jgi:NADH-quinone oxidoreductase subunit A
MSTDLLVRDYLPIAVLFTFATVLAFVIILLSSALGPRRANAVKAEAYESGMRAIGPAVRRIPLRYYLVAVLFILFDIEVVFFLPWAVTLKQLGLFSLIEMFVFLGILLVGYIYVWKRGALAWE